MGGLEEARFRLLGVGEGASLETEQLGLEQPLRDGGAVDGDERAAGARARAMEDAGHQTLAGSRLALDQDRREAGGSPGAAHEPADIGAEGLHGRAGTEYFLHRPAMLSPGKSGCSSFYQSASPYNAYMPKTWRGMERVARHIGGTRVLAPPLLRLLAILAGLISVLLVPEAHRRWAGVHAILLGFIVHSLALIAALWRRPGAMLRLNAWVLAIDVESRPGEGTTFTVTFPAEGAEVPA